VIRRAPFVLNVHWFLAKKRHKFHSHEIPFLQKTLDVKWLLELTAIGIEIAVI
jgi:hypothetical protein